MSPLPTRYRWILLLSLALNLALAGFLVLRPESRGSVHMPGLPPPHVLGRVVSDQGRAHLRDSFAQHRAEIRPALQRYAASKREIPTLLRQDPVDRTRLEQAFATLRAHETALAEVVQQMLVDFSTRLSLADRERIADLIDRHDQRRKDRRQEREARRKREGAD